jgi:hypothetical protein
MNEKNPFRNELLTGKLYKKEGTLFKIKLDVATVDHKGYLHNEFICDNFRSYHYALIIHNYETDLDKDDIIISWWTIKNVKAYRNGLPILLIKVKDLFPSAWMERKTGHYGCDW